MKHAPQSVPAQAPRDRQPATQAVTVARAGGKHAPVSGRREPPKPPAAKPKLSDFETELMAAWDA
jgi:hypothetical protein